MEKKDIIFLATSSIFAAHVPKGLPTPEDSKDQSASEYFTKWYDFLSRLYDELPKIN